MNEAVLAHRTSTVTLVAIFVCTACSSPRESHVRDGAVVKVAGEMRSVMQRGDLSATINLDTVEDRQHLYGIGPLDSLTGEITILDGVAYYSIIVNDKQALGQSFTIKAPFFVYANVPTWDEIQIPDSVTTEIHLDEFITAVSEQRQEPFVFTITATIDTADIHIVSLPTGTVINSPADTHIGQKNLTLINSSVDLVGFFSRNHKGVFTHHDSNIHLHLITADRTSMGHVDRLRLRGSTVLNVQK